DHTTWHNAINNTLKAIKNSKNDSKTLSTKSIGQDYGLPEATLRRAIKNNSSFIRPGRAKILTDHKKEQLVGYCLNMQRLGFGLTKSGVNQCVMDIIRRDRRSYPFSKNRLGQKWWKRFMNDHPELSFRIPQALNEAHVQKANPVIVKDHFDKLQKIILEYSLIADQIWNM
ncbi:13679_t:CDS:1, partial [Racocetra fulgida]